MAGRGGGGGGSRRDGAGFFFPRRDGAVVVFFRGGTGRLFFLSEAGRGVFWRDGAKSLHRPAKGGLNRPASRPCKALVIMVFSNLRQVFFLFFFNLTYSRWTSSLPSCLWSLSKDLPISPRFTPYDFFVAMQVQKIKGRIRCTFRVFPGSFYCSRGPSLVELTVDDNSATGTVAVIRMSLEEYAWPSHTYIYIYIYIW